MATVTEDCRLIGAILPRGAGQELLRRLREEKDIHRADIGGGRGLDHMLQFTPHGTGEEFAVEILSAVVPAGRADEIFQFVFEAAKVDRPDGGIVFEHALSGASPFLLPELPEED